MKALAIAGITIRRVSRDRQAFFFILLLPFLIILIVGSATKNFASSRTPIGYTVASSGPRTDDLVRAIEHAANLRATRVDTLADLRRSLRRGLYAAGVVVPSEYEQRIARGGDIDIPVIANQSRPPTAVRASIDAAIAKEGAFLQAANFATAHSKRSFDQNLRAAKDVAEVVKPISVKTETLGRRSRRTFIMSGFDYTAPSQVILFAFITALAGSAIIILNRQQGITRRMYAAPTTARTVVLGETLGRFILSAFQAVFIVTLGIVFFGVDFGDAVGAAVLVLLFVLVCTSVAVLAGTVFKTPEQAGSVGPALGIAAGMLAGCMWPRFVMPLPMQRIGQLFPQAWAMDAFIKLIARGAGVRGILPELAILAGYVAVLLPIATWRLRRSITA